VNDFLLLLLLFFKKAFCIVYLLHNKATQAHSIPPPSNETADDDLQNLLSDDLELEYEAEDDDGTEVERIGLTGRVLSDVGELLLGREQYESAALLFEQVR
jgi:hypothetical protein